ncbi:carboxymuconolactone decarboxylase family protein [Amycolatopsis saalfeldensis]|uniref:Alkylhydroperoxidase AhpD family core domain-containing protein n=1 Tax=Amycolatopsis saalfeldensis TaxID=394193 RepID=A0A1H8YLY5_9PSEU|nr:carboxymuconolactone decarboxylase family protein [Amycolatopsis saalfeldensis]SEP52408.1 alkylhydroperoxidase AhpD family core domain-containing protein [Amycolatopsis saalfeldensis]
MSGSLLGPVLRRSPSRIRHVTAVRPAEASGLVAEVYARTERDFGLLAPPIALHSPAPEILAAAWLMLRETLVACHQLDRAAKEVVATAVSLGNACPYCVDVHGSTLDGLGQGRDGTALTGGHPESITDPVLREVAGWAEASTTRAAALRYPARFTAGQTAELAGVAVTFQYLNRMVNVFLGGSPLPPVLPTAARAGGLRLLGRFMRQIAQERHRPGSDLGLLPAAPVHQDLAWAGSNRYIEDAFARAGAVIDAAGGRSVPRPVRELLGTTLSGWDGRPAGPSRAWADDAVSVLPGANRAAGRLALLTALASYQVDESVIGEFRREQPGDRVLIELTSWASLTAARQAGSWLGPRARTAGPDTEGAPDRHPHPDAGTGAPVRELPE